MRDTALFDVRIRRELAECQDAELRVMSDEALRKMLEGVNRRAGFRKVSRLKGAAVERLTPVLGAEAARATVDRIIDDVPELEPQMTPLTLLRQADKRIEADLDAMRADVDAALACVEGDQDGDPVWTRIRTQGSPQTRPGAPPRRRTRDVEARRVRGRSLPCHRQHVSAPGRSR